MYVVRPIVRYAISRDGTVYYFRPGDEDVLVTLRSATVLGDTYAVPLTEARALWRRLVGRGYRREYVEAHTGSVDGGP